jgi:hypothetical protein
MWLEALETDLENVLDQIQDMALDMDDASVYPDAFGLTERGADLAYDAQWELLFAASKVLKALIRIKEMRGESC